MRYNFELTQYKLNRYQQQLASIRKLYFLNTLKKYSDHADEIMKQIIKIGPAAPEDDSKKKLFTWIEQQAWYKEQHSGGQQLENLSKEQLAKAEQKAKDTGIENLPEFVNNFPGHIDEILAQAIKGKTQDDLENWIMQQDWGKVSQEKEMSPKYPKLTIEQATLADSKAKQIGLAALPQIASDFPEHADDIIEHATNGMTQSDLVKWIGEQKDTWAKEEQKTDSDAKEVTRPDGKKEDRTQSTDEDEKYPVDKSVDEYTKYITDSFIASLVKIAQGGVTQENDTEYLAARNRIGAFYRYAREHNLTKKTFEVEAFKKKFKIPDTWAKAKDEDKIGKTPEKVGALVDLYKKCQNYDFRFTVTEGKYRFTKEFNELYKTFYFLFLVCHLIKNDANRINNNYTFKQRTKKTNLQQLYNEILALLNKIHKDSFGKESDVEELNIKGQSNKAIDRKAETLQAEETSKVDESKPLSDNTTAAESEKGTEAAEKAIEKNAQKEMDKKGVTQKLDLSWYPPIQKKYKDFVAAYTKQCNELENKELGQRLLSSFRRCQAIQILSDIYKNDVKSINSLSVFTENEEMFRKIFANPMRTKEGQVYEFVPSKGGTPELNADNEASFRDRMRNRRESSKNRRDTLSLIKQVREDVTNNKTLQELKQKALQNEQAAKQTQKNFADATSSNTTPPTMDEWRVADKLYCNTIFVIRYFGLSEGSEGDKEEKKEWLPVLQSLYKKKDKCKLSDALFVSDIGLKKANTVFSGDLGNDVTLQPAVKETTPYYYLASAYKSLLEEDSLTEFTKYATALLPNHLKQNLMRICFLMDRRAKNEDNFNPSKGLRILRDGLHDLFEQETLKQKDLNNLVPDSEYDLARDADALYRLCCQGENINYQQPTSPDYLLYGIFQKWLDYSNNLGKFIKKGKQLKVRT